MRVLVACEFSGIVREAFKDQGYDAWSCDLLDTDIPGKHIKGDIRDVLKQEWDLMIAHPPCTYLTVSGNKWFKSEYQDRFPTRKQDREEAIEFFKLLYEAPIVYKAIENPVGILSSRFRKPDQIIQPWQFGHPESKKTCLWLQKLPLLKATKIVDLPMNKAEAQKLHYLPPSNDRWKLRSTTFKGIAEAMATQWGSYVFSRI